MIEIQQFHDQLSKIPDENIEANTAYWADRDLKTVVSEMPALERFGNADVAVLDPEFGDTDETQTFVLPLEFTQGYTPSHYMRGRTMQLLAGPNSRVVIMPNTTWGKKHVDFNSAFNGDELTMLKSGNYQPYGDLLMDSLERADLVRNFGMLMIHGSSQGGLSALSIAAAGSGRLNIGGVSAVEVPSMSNRSPLQLGKDFMASGGDLGGAVAGSENAAQSEAMSGIALGKDIGKFIVYASCTKTSRILGRAMSGSANEIVHSALDQLDAEAPITLQYVEGSKIFDPKSIASAVARSVRMIYIVGEDAQKHATPNNLRFNAAMAHEGLALSS